MSRERIGCGVLAVVGVGVLAVVAYWLIPPSYDQKTAELAEHMTSMTEAQWNDIYTESARIFSSSSEAERADSNRLSDDELPKLMRGLGFDRCHVTTEGVFYDRIGGGWHLNGTRVHSIHAPGSDHYDRVGIWFDGFKTEGWVYEPAVTKRAEQAGADQPATAPELKAE